MEQKTKVNRPDGPGPNNSKVKDYLTMQVLSARPEKLILMLYDGALRFMNLAIQGIDEHKNEKAHNNLIKAQRIMIELMTSLNFDKGGEIAGNLFRIYEFMHYTLVQANIKKEKEPILAICEQLKVLRESWNKALKNQFGPRAEGEGGGPRAETGNPEKKSFEIKG
jgi:flagellar secretion chaperone FliS